MEKIIGIIHEPANSKNFIRYASRLAKDLSVDLLLLYMQNPEDYPLGMVGSTGTAVAHLQTTLLEVTAKAEDTIQEYAEEVKKEYPLKINITVRAEVGFSADIIKEIITDGNKNLVLLEGKENVSFWTQDPANMDIIDQVNGPVCIVPPNTDYHPYNEILYATDYKSEDISTIKRMMTIADPFFPNITALHITDNADFQEKIMEAGFLEMIKEKTGLQKVSVKSIPEKEHEEISDTIHQYTTANEVHLLVILKENRHFLDRIFKPNRTRKIIKNINIPVLVFHEEQ